MSVRAKMKLEVIAAVASVLVVVGGVIMLSGGPEAAPGAKHVICHFDGQAGTDKFQRIECGSGCINGHFLNDGTPKAGHEEDILDPAGGVCPGGGPYPSPSPNP